MAKRIYSTIIDFLKKTDNDHVNAYSSQASLFIILSIFPFLMLLLTIIQYTPIERELLISWTTKITPDVIDPLMKTISEELFESTGGAAVISITAVLALWSASRGILSIIRGLNSAFQAKDKRNYFWVRFLSCIYTVIFLAGIILSLALIVFGQSIYKRIENENTFLFFILHSFLKQKWLISICILTLFFLLLYRALPAKKHTLTMLLPGAVFSAVGWVITSSMLSYYISYSPSFTYIYGSLITFIVFMLWMYLLMYVLLLGAEISVYFRIIFLNARSKIKIKFKALK